MKILPFLNIRNIIILIIILVLAAGAFFYFGKSSSASVSYKTALLGRGDILISIKSTGTVEPEESIDVGAQISGQLQNYGKDKNGKPIDYGSVVEEGMFLAKIDDSLYAANLESAKAQLMQAEASLKKAEADLEQLKAKWELTKSDLKRAEKLKPTDAIAQSSYDSYKSAHDVAAANISVGEATVLQARATVAQSRAQLDYANRNLGYCTIKSPVDGVIIDRRVNIGQTVNASMSTPSIFLIAKDLKRMQIWVSVNEADIGKIYKGQPVRFTVDAFPGETFKGEVSKVRLNASLSQNVVTYTVEVLTDNSSGKLLPYLTANVEFEVANRKNVLIVQNSALRWTPKTEDILPESKEKFMKFKTTKASQSKSENNNVNAVIWTQEGRLFKPFFVKALRSDGTFTEIEESPEIKEGISLICGQKSKNNVENNSANPFVPKMPGGKKR